MLSFIKRRAFLSVLGFLLLAVFLWYAGPYFAFGYYHPLETAFARLIAIALVALLWVASAALKRWRAGRASDKLVAAVLSQPQLEQSRPSAEVAKLRERFEEAVATLKQQRRSGHSLYDLPWYVFIGAPGSGKTTALLNSGLKFPLEQRMGKGALQGVGGTRNCDWWFTDEAVFLDTAGRYTTQDSDAASDSAAWGEFLALLRKYRSRRPVNGVILTISAQDLLLQGDSGRESQVEAARRRLIELNQELHIQLPVYLMVTKCDLVAGFAEYFDELTQEGRAQVWGVTFPYEQTVNGEATGAFPTEFDAMIGRLNARAFERVEEERDSRRRTRVFGFPQQMAGLRNALGRFVSEVFGSTRFDQPILLRGVYFTSGTQDGTPIDRLLGAIGRRFGVASEAVAASTGRGKAYFVERLLKEVLIGESGLAGVNRRVEMRNAALQLGAYAAMALLAVLGIIALSVSYRRNQAFIAEVAADLAQVRAVPAIAPEAPLEALLPRLDAIRAVVDSTDRYRTDTPWAMRWGLSQGGSVGNSARDAYLRELDGILLPRFALRVKERLVEYASEPEKLYVYLKAYLMLGDPRNLDKAHLQFLADLEWNRTDGAVRATGVSPSKHFESLLAYGESLRPIGVDPSLIAQARSTVRRASIPQIMYGRLKRSRDGDTGGGVRLDVAAGLGVGQVLRRRSGVSLSEPVPALYSRAVFKEATGPGMIELVKQFAGDGWVWGEGGLPVGNPVTLAADVTQLYERDYIAAWDAILNDLEPVPFSTVSQTADALGILAGSTSPLRGLLRAVVENTSLVDSPDTTPPSGALSSAGKKVTEGLGKLLKPVQEALGQSGVAPGSLVTAHFQEIHRLLAGAPGSAPLDGVLKGIGEIQQQLRALGPEVGASDPLEALSNPALRGILQALRREGATLPPSVGGLITEIGEKTERSVIAGATSDLQSRYERQVLNECVAIVAGRYPFSEGSSNDVPLADFGRLFGYGGRFDTFFNNNMEKLVDTASTPWTWRPGAVTSSRRLLVQFELAQRMRETFFRSGSQVPQLNFTAALTRGDNATRRFILEIDGQRFDDRANPGSKNPVVWPGRGSGMAAATFEDFAGTWPPSKFDGPWAWFRLVDAGRPRPDGDLRTVLSYQAGAYQARVAVEATSIRNAFAQQDWRRFSCEP
jgi:type VI secretion system protein ImpL